MISVLACTPKLEELASYFFDLTKEIIYKFFSAENSYFETIQIQIVTYASSIKLFKNTSL